MNMKLYTVVLSLTLFVSAFGQEKSDALNMPDIAYPIFSLKKSVSGNYLFVTLSGGRFLLYDVGKGRLTENSMAVWKNFTIKGFELGGDAEFSHDEKYILVSEQNAMYSRDKAKVRLVRVVVLETLTGKVIYEMDGANSAQFLKDNQSILLTDDEGIYTYNFIKHEKGEKKRIGNCETACVNNAEKILAVSYDPTRDEFKKEDGAGLNKKELKNAVRNKKLIAFYEYPSLKKIGITNEEVDVVFKMQFTSDDNYLLFFSRTWQVEHEHVNMLNGMDKTNDLNQFQRIDMQNLVVDNLNFIHQTSEPMANFDLSLNADVFVFGENKGLFAGKREIDVVKFSEQQVNLGTYTFQGRSNSRNLFSPAFTIENETTLLVANGLRLSYWNFAENPKYTENIEPVNKNSILDKAISQIDSDIENPESSLSKSIAKKQLSGLYILNISIQKNGEVVSVFAQSDDKTNILMQNSLKDIILKYKFDVSVPKNERLKFTYTFNL